MYLLMQKLCLNYPGLLYSEDSVVCCESAIRYVSTPSGLVWVAGTFKIEGCAFICVSSAYTQTNTHTPLHMPVQVLAFR